VLEDPALEDGRTIDLAFVVLRALNGRSPGDAVTQFDGGPGAAVTPIAAPLAQARSALRAERDILLLDHRGTGNSMGLFCVDPFPGGIASRFETVFPLDQIDACRERLSERTDLTQYTTQAAMDDLAAVATWLGYSSLNLIGGSYGTREAQIFTRRHPEMVRTVVMDGVAPVDERVYLYHARDLQASLDNLLEECAQQAECARAYPDLPQVLAEVLSRATNDPPQVLVEGARVRFGIGPLSYALRGLLYGQSGTVPARLYEAHRGDWQRLAEYYLGRQAWVGAAQGVPAGYHYSVLCAEDIDPLTWDDIERETRGSFMGPFLIGGYKTACDRWDSAQLPRSYFTAVESPLPALLLSGGRDPVTPVVGAERVAAGWPNGLHVVVENGGHGQGGPCINGLVLDFIATASIQGLDTDCVESPPPTRFELPRS
jgi:pimeloyl-ACP methyl ester carboxylesterase